MTTTSVKGAITDLVAREVMHQGAATRPDSPDNFASVRAIARMVTALQGQA